MNVEYTWVIRSFERIKQQGNVTNVVSKVIGDLYGHDAETDIRASFPFVCKLNTNIDVESFIDYDSIDENIVLNWIQTTYSEERIAEMKQALINEIVELNEKEFVEPPWNS